MLPIQGSKVRAFIQSRRERLRQYLVDLIRARTGNPPGDEHLAAQVMTAWCEARGIAHETFEKEPGRTNVVARIGSGRPRVMVPLHFDVVPAGDGWETDPFEPVERNGRIIGRGAKDNKGPLAAMMLAAEFLKQNEAGLSGQLILVGAADEEAGSALGMRYLTVECGLEAEMAIVPDAGHSMRLIDVGEKGALFLKVIAEGRQAHGSTPERGASALWPTIDFLERIRGWRPEGPASDLFTPPTLNVGAIHAGSVPNMVPGRCEAMVDIRYLPGTDGEAILSHVRGALGEVEAKTEGVRMRLEVLSDQPPTQVTPDHPMVGVLQDRTEEVTGVRPKPYGQSGATVAKFLILQGIPAVGFMCGPDGVEHTAGEWIDLEELARFAEVMALAVWDLAGGAHGT
ncbi:MAG: ArgE/DapE family deacylase [Phycisphaerae bacterium]